ncbi:hypothetical protein M1O24_00150 [Dehalococcoidia bacterium]|nr:hypothetical protein [Dehalococcoidia bacterium]
MKGDKLIIKDEHRRAALGIMDLLWPELETHRGKYILTIAGESGSGKSEIAAVLAEMLAQRGIETLIIQQDDYFIYPPQTNLRMRLKDIGWVGESEVRLELLDQNLGEILAGKDEIEKPLAMFDEDCITTERIKVSGVGVIIVEGTYTTLLRNAQSRVFIDRDYHHTREARLERGREAQDAFLEQVLQIEHEIISRHKSAAGIIVGWDYSVSRSKEK